MFRVDTVIVYEDHSDRDARTEGALLEKILRYHETPQYLRKYLFKRDPDLEFAGVLPPLRAPHHPDVEKPRVGQLREGVVLFSDKTSEVHAGFKHPVKVEAHLARSQRLTVRITRVNPEIEGEVVDLSRLTIYWGPQIRRDNQTLGQIIREGKHDLAISTSRKGDGIRQSVKRLQASWMTAKNTLVIFGSPREGVPEILAREHTTPAELSYNLNMIPLQAVQTVRTEEAVHATLAILNSMEET